MPKRKSEELLKENARIHKNTMEFHKKAGEKRREFKEKYGNMEENK